MNRRLMVIPRPASAACRSSVCRVQPRLSRDTNLKRRNAWTTASHRQGCRLLKMSGIPPGLWPCTDYEATVFRLEPGDSVLFCTDGVTDSMNMDEESFGTKTSSVAICDREHLADLSDAPARSHLFGDRRLQPGARAPRRYGGGFVLLHAE